jgi:hypothetical protein
LGNADKYECSMSTLGYLRQVISKVTAHFGSKTTGVLRAEGQ